MKSARARVGMIYVLTGVVLLLIIYLVIFSYQTLNPEETVTESEEETISMPEVAVSCTSDMTTSDFDNIVNNENLCNSLNRINITDVTVGSTNMNIVVFYRPDSKTEDTGVYINDVLISNVANIENQYKFTSRDDKLFMTTITAENANLTAYNQNLMIVYNLVQTLDNLQMVDQVLNVALDSTNIDGNSITVNDDNISFNSTSGTCTNGVSGVNYIINYAGSTFENPQVVNNITC